MPALIIHGHFYQPPRENPWTGLIEPQPSAAPFHDWNERIHSECYEPNAFARISDPTTGQLLTINNYANISFNFGPTLLSWLESNHPDTYARIIEADRDSALKHNGHGNAIAQAFGTLFCRFATSGICVRRFVGDWRIFAIALAETPSHCGCQRPLATTRCWTRSSMKACVS